MAARRKLAAGPALCSERWPVRPFASFRNTNVKVTEIPQQRIVSFHPHDNTPRTSITTMPSLKAPART